MLGRPIRLQDARLTDPFWSQWQRALLDRGLAHQYGQCVQTGRLENFQRAARGEATGHEGLYFNDSDVYKWLEAAAYALQLDPQWEGRALVDEAVRTVAAAQCEDGYIGTAFQIGAMDKRWKALAAKHEMYCIGHLVEAAVAHREATGEQGLFAVGKKAADHVVGQFGGHPLPRSCGHQEIELAFARLSGATGDDKYRSLAARMIQARGHRPSPFAAEFEDPVAAELDKGYVPLVFVDGRYDGAYFQDHVPFLEQDTPVGHAVRAMYYYCGALDCWDDPAVLKALSTIWSNLVRGRIYVTGGIGSAGKNEGFTDDYDLPNLDAYSETCAAIGLVFWAARMSRATGDARYADWMERALYNAVLSGTNFETDRYFYVNPLESRGHHQRQAWFLCACCPPNLARLILSVQTYAAYTSDDGGLVIDLPIGAEYRLSGTTVSVDASYPWSGDIRLRSDSGATVRIRVPSWARGVRLDGAEATVTDRYLTLRLIPGRESSVEFDMRAEWLVANPLVSDDAGKAAILRGPLVYCLEEHDFERPVHLFRPDPGAPLKEVGRSHPRWAVNLRVSGCLEEADADRALYSPRGGQVLSESLAEFVPYFTWANRTPGSMAVWHRPQ